MLQKLNAVKAISFCKELPADYAETAEKLGFV
jgi:hypothetical protein